MKIYLSLIIKTITSLISLTIKGDIFVVIGNSLWRRNVPVFKDAEQQELIISNDLKDTKSRIKLALDWILSAQSLQKDGGVSGWILLHMFYRVARSYPEVTGYIIPTVFDCYKLFKEKKIFDSAVRMADFEVSIQMPDGAFQGNVIKHRIERSVFNTAQIIHGLVRTYKMTEDRKYLGSAVKAADWIISVQNPDGSWSKYNYMNLKRVYDSKVSECLLELYHITSKTEYNTAAVKNLDFVLENQNKNYWFENCDNSLQRNSEPLTHTIGYTVQGLLECGSMLKEEKFLTAAQNTLDILLKKFELRKDLLNGRYNRDWAPTVKSSCVTGCAQISICWMRLFEATNDLKYLNAAFKMNDYLKAIQYLKGSSYIKGSLPASYPIWGDYGPWVINSWGVKYFIDALVLEHKHKLIIIEEKLK